MMCVVLTNLWLLTGMGLHDT